MVALIIAFLVFFAIGPVVASEGPRAVVEHLSSLGSRVAGYPGSVRAAEYVEGRLQALGLATRRDSFAVVVPMDRGGRLEWEGESVPLYAVWPNGVRTSTVPPEGLRASAIWGGDGDWGDFNGQEVAGRVVVLDFASGDNWLKAASLGARAVVFVAADLATTQQAQGKYLRAPLDVPRFWVEGAAGERLRRRLVDGEVEVGLWGRMDWQERMAYNVWAVVPGKDAGTAQNETVLVHAYYDAPSVVPAQAPGAEAAVSVAALLEVAARLQANSPTHTVILAALSAHFQGRQGMVAFLDRHARRQEHYAARLAEPLNIDLFIGLDLSSHGERVVLWNNTDSYALKRFFVPFGRRFAEYAETLGRAEAVANGISPIRGMDWDSYMPGGLSADGELALEAGFPSLTLATVGDARFALDLPRDTSEGVAWGNVEGQAALVADLLTHALADTALLAGRERLEEALKDRLRDLRVKARTFPRRSQVPDRPVAGALVAVQVEQEERKGVRDTRYFLADATGTARIPGLVQGTYPLALAALDAEQGTITYIADLSTRAQAHHGKPRADGRLAKNVRWTQNEQIAVLFPGVGRPLYGLVEPRLLRALNEVKVLSATGSEPGQYGYALGKSSTGSVGVIYGPADAATDDRIKVILDGQFLLLNSEGSQSEAEARGQGFSLTEEGFGGATLQAARDVWNLDAARLGMLKEHGIENQRLTRLHAQAAAAIAEAEAAAEQLKWDEYVAWSRKALGLETRAYPEVLATLNDVLEGVIFFMALLLPAAFFGERLLFAAADIRRQLAGFGLLLLAIWLILAQVHPAFELAEPLVVLLAFAIMAMAAFVLFMLVGRFNRVMAQHQSQQTRVHAQDLSRMSASYAAFMLGISNMRRRPLRTGLTLATLTLLTFTLLSFTSFEQQIRYASFQLPHTGAYPGILIRDRGWERLTSEALDYAESHFSGSGWMGRRGWIAAEGGKGGWIAVAAAGNAVRATGLLGLTPEEAHITEVDKSLVAGSFFAADDEATCILPLDMAEALGVGVGDQVEVFGRALKVRGIADPERLGELRDSRRREPDAGRFCPVGRRDASTGGGAGCGYCWRGGSSRTAALHPPKAAPRGPRALSNAGRGRWELALGGRALSGRDRRAGAGRGLSDAGGGHLVCRLAGWEVMALSSVGLTAVQGLGVLAIPALVAALIVLNAMLGAVYERLREIGIYSSVGLAPLHIALLFVAEACVYAVLGTTLGYLLGQGLGRVLLGLGLLQGLTLNYSSLAAIGAALAVMGVVLLSTIYPARQAARQAVPDVVRRWRPDPPSGDEWLFEFPFMLGEGEVEGVCGFLANYFGAFGRATLGDFYVEDMQVTQAGGYRLSFTLWLAPFDLGVSQEVVVEFVPAGERSRAMEVRLRRLSGERHYWQRLNLRLVEALRKQMLIWYALREIDRVQHVESARALAAEQAEERVEEQAAAEQPASFTWRGFAVGALLALGIGVGAPYAVIMLQGSYMALNSSSPGAIFLFFVLVVVVNTLLRALGRGLALGRADLVLIYAMMLLASAVPTQAFVGYLIPIISGLYYYATPENNWGEIFFPHVTPWLVPQDRQAIVDLHEGLSPGESIPWGAWSETLSYWYVFFLVLSFMMLCMSSILHRQWSQHERLAYPMVQLPLKMVEEGQPGFKLAPLFKQRLLWIGFAVPFVLLSFKGLHYYFPAVPQPIQSAGQLGWIGEGPKLNLHWVYAWIGFFYLVNLDISFSIWFFYLFNKAQEGIFASLGIASSEKLSLYSYSQTADLTHEVMGACLIFVAYTLWMGRRHLGAVWRKAWRGDPAVDDAGEMLSYRVAVFGFLVSLLFVGVWLWASGVPLAILPLFLLVCLIFYVFVTRAVATAGLATARSPMVAAFFVISAVGAPVIGAKGLTALTFTYIWQSEMRLFPMIAAANSLKLAEAVVGSKRRLFWGMALALVVSLAGATWIIFQVCYEHGGINLHPFFMTRQANRTFTDMARPIVDPLPADMRGWLFTGIGGLVEAVLLWGHHRFYWWPLHPLGFIVSVGWLANQVWFSVLIAWALKLGIVKWGGMPLYERAKPFFLGLILGEATAAGLWLCIDGVLGETGHFLSYM